MRAVRMCDQQYAPWPGDDMPLFVQSVEARNLDSACPFAVDQNMGLRDAAAANFFHGLVFVFKFVKNPSASFLKESKQLHEQLDT